MNKKRILYIIILILTLTIILISINSINSNPQNYSNLKHKTLLESNTMNNVIWVRGEDMYNINFKTLKDSNIDTILLNYGAIEFYGKDNISKWVETANKNGINVHIWMQVLYNKGFQNPLNGTNTNTELLNKDINDAKEYASIPGIKGITLDYIRYPGTASYNPGGSEAINTFVINLTNTIKSVNSNLIVSGSLMPEDSTKLITDYGQNLTVLSSTLDYIIPMEYKGNYEENSDWIKNMSNYFTKNSQNAKVIVSLQTYQSDNNLSQLTKEEFNQDINSAYSGGASGIGIFRYGLCNYTDYRQNLGIINHIRCKIRNIT